MRQPTMRILRGSLGSLAADLACDEALLDEAEETGRGACLRFWDAQRLAVVLGASGRLALDVHEDACAADGVAIGRRSSGGGTVVIGPGALNVAVVLPLDFDGALAAVESAQRYVLERSAERLPGAEVRGSGDLAIGGRKFSGSAQRRLRRHVLVHFSILYRFPLERIPRYLAEPRRRPDYRGARTHLEFLTNLPLGRDEIAAAVEGAWCRPDRMEPVAGSPPLDRVERLIVEKHGRSDWIRRF